MPRSGPVIKRKIAPDPIYQSILVAKLINKLMVDGKKQLAQNIVYGAFKKIEKQTHRNPLAVFEQAVRNIAPRAEVRPRRVGGATYMVPLEVRGLRRDHLALKWLIEATNARDNSEYVGVDRLPIVSSKLAAEILAAAAAEGGAVVKKEAVQKAAEANRAFAHFRW